MCLPGLCTLAAAALLLLLLLLSVSPLLPPPPPPPLIGNSSAMAERLADRYVGGEGGDFITPETKMFPTSKRFLSSDYRRYILQITEETNVLSATEQKVLSIAGPITLAIP